MPVARIELQPLAAEIAAEVGLPLQQDARTPYEAIVARAARASPALGQVVLSTGSAAALAEVSAGDDENTAAPTATIGPESGPDPHPESHAPGAAQRLPAIPLFSELPPEAFVALAERVNLHRVAAGEVVLREGELGTSFFAVAAGRVRVEKARPEGPLVLAHLGEGTFFGEMALLSGAQRAASVVAEEPTELLEIEATALVELAHRHPQVAGALTAFYRQRLLENALVTSPFFRPFGRADRLALARRFRTRGYEPGATLVAEGAPSPALFVVLSGELDVTRAAGAAPGTAPALVARLAEGDVFGEMSCLSKGSASATVTARRRSTLLELPRADFDAVMSAYPPVLELVAGLSDARRPDLDQPAPEPDGAPPPFAV